MLNIEIPLKTRSNIKVRWLARKGFPLNRLKSRQKLTRDVDRHTKLCDGLEDSDDDGCSRQVRSPVPDTVARSQAYPTAVKSVTLTYILYNITIKYVTGFVTSTTLRHEVDECQRHLTKNYVSLLYIYVTVKAFAWFTNKIGTL
jgi:hypothetical protein